MSATPITDTSPRTTRTVRAVLMNASALLASYVLPRALTFAAALIAARVLQPTAFGAYGSALALAMVFSILGSFGMLPLLIREIARSPERADALVAAAHRIKLVTVSVMLVAILLVARLLSIPSDVTLAALLLAAGNACWSFAENYGARLQAAERMGLWFHGNLIFGIGSGVLATLGVVLTDSVAWFCAGFAAGQFMALGYLHLRLRRTAAAHDDSNWNTEVIPLARAAVPFAAAFFALAIFYKADVLLLARLRGAYDVGIYAAGYKLVDVAHALAVVGSGAVFPRLARGSAGDGARRSMELFMLLAVLASGSLWLIRSPLVEVLFGPAYMQASAALALLAPATAILTLNILAGYLLGVADRVELLGIAYAGAATFKLLLGATFMIGAGATGAATAMLISEIVLCVGLVLALRAARVPLPRLHPTRLAAIAVAWAWLSSLMLPAVPATVLFIAGTAALYVTAGALSTGELRSLRDAVTPGRTEAAT